MLQKSPQILVFTATYNEKENINEVLTGIWKTAPEADILVIDDNSPDGTGEMLQKMAESNPQLIVKIRPNKQGVGSAHRYAIQYARTHNYDRLITMDADFSHDPAVIASILEGLESHDFVIGSRFAKGGKLDYSGFRRVISVGANWLARKALGLSCQETTTSYRGFNKALLQKLPIERVQAEGYSFFLECTYVIGQTTTSILEIPIHFQDRRFGKSKISQSEIYKGFRTLFRLSYEHLKLRIRQNKMQSFLKGLIAFKIVAAILYCGVGFVHPHILRQSVTLAVSQRYAIDWKYHQKEFPFLPRSLAAGDKDGILEMEFPILNYFTAPAFFLPTEDARVVARLICVLLFIALWYVHFLIWRKITILGISCEWPSLILVLLPISGMYFQRFMPDFFSFILCSIAVGLSLRRPKLILAPLIFAALGLLEKPTSIVVFGSLLLLPYPFQEIKSRLRWLIPSTFIAVIYYTVGMRWIHSLSDLEKYYKTEFRDPLSSLMEFISRPSEIFHLFFEKLTSPYLPLIIFCFWAYRKFPRVDKRSYFLWGLLALQAFGIVLMDGAHAFVHSYYYIGLSMTAALILTYYLSEKLQGRSKLFLLVPLMAFNVENVFYELRDGISPAEHSTQHFWQSCKLLKERHPEFPWSQGVSFRSELTPVSEMGLCFGEIQSSEKSQYGFLYTDEKIPKDCRKIDEDGELCLINCRTPGALTSR